MDRHEALDPPHPHAPSPPNHQPITNPIHNQALLRGEQARLRETHKAQLGRYGGMQVAHSVCVWVCFGGWVCLCLCLCVYMTPEISALR